jgi:hypothetical protein
MENCRLSSVSITKYGLQPWQIIVSASIFAYMALGAVTGSFRTYHWFMLLVIPLSLKADKRGRQFFLDWAPMIAFWLIYDRLRLLQPYILQRVAVEWPYSLELWAFGWLSGGDIPAHAGRAWLAAQAGSNHHLVTIWFFQLIYFSHIFAIPLLLFYLWVRGGFSQSVRIEFVRCIRAFTALNFLGLAVYLLLPVSPPWWVSLNGIQQPTQDLLSRVDMSAAMDGTLVRGMIKNAAHWFAAVPSLHGAYPVLALLLACRWRNRWLLAALALYCASMWTATVMLNQHYIIDLLAGALLAVIAWLIVERMDATTRISPDLVVSEDV